MQINHVRSSGPICGLVAITDPTLPSPDLFLDACLRTIEHTTLPWIQLRAKTLPHRERLRIAYILRSVCDAHHTRLMINTDKDIAYAVRADALHLPSTTAFQDIREVRQQAPWLRVSRACHTLDQIAQASSYGYDAVTFSPVAPPLSKPDDTRPTLGLETLAAACARHPSLSIIALGGITPAWIPECRRVGASGVASISAVFRTADPHETQHLINLWDRSPDPYVS